MNRYGLTVLGALLAACDTTPTTTLHLPSGFTFRSRTLDADLVVRAVNHQATVVQDDNDNTYLESQ